MTTGYGSYTMKEVQEEVKEMRRFHEGLRKNPEEARKLLINAGILNRSGTKLAKKYRSK